MTKVIIEIANPTVVEIVQNVRVTFPDMLGTIGKTLGGKIIYFMPS